MFSKLNELLADLRIAETEDDVYFCVTTIEEIIYNTEAPQDVKAYVDALKEKIMFFFKDECEIQEVMESLEQMLSAMQQ